MTFAPKLRESGNRLLDRLPHAEWQALSPRLQTTTLQLKQVIHEKNVDVVDIYFPTTVFCSVLMVLEDDDPIETATVGREGLIGVSATLGVLSSPHRVICQMPGNTLSLPVAALQEAMFRGSTLSRLVQRYSAYLLHMTGQTLACNALHSVEARASRWLLMTHDQAGGNEFPLTQEFMAYMLGVRRQGVTEVAGALQHAGLISYRRGAVTILDRPSLEKAACECYETSRMSYDQALHGNSTDKL